MRPANENDPIPIFRSPLTWARITIGLAWCTVGLLALSILAELQGVNDKLPATRPQGAPRIEEVADRLMPVAQVLLAVAFLVWLFRVRKNVAAFGITRLRWSQRWTILGWFVPVVCLYAPYQIVADIWRGSQPDATHENWHTKAAPPKVFIWWVCVLTGGIGMQALSFMAGGAGPYDDKTMAGILNALSILASLLALGIVGEITRLQAERHGVNEGGAVLG